MKIPSEMPNALKKNSEPTAFTYQQAFNHFKVQWEKKSNGYNLTSKVTNLTSVS